MILGLGLISTWIFIHLASATVFQDENRRKRQTGYSTLPAWINSGKFQGDIAGFQDQAHFDKFVRGLNSWQQHVQLTDTKLVDSAISDPRGLWASGRVPYVIISSSEPLRNAVNAAIRDFHAQTCVRFVPRTAEINYLSIIDSDSGCWSYLGNIRLGAQNVSLSDGCQTKGTALHELMHAIGFWHEHQRTDRDAYVDVIENNIEPNCFKRNFGKAKLDQMLLIGRYDVDSVMHYPSMACSLDGRQPMKLKNSDRVIFGGGNELTSEDIRKIRILYRCDRPVATVPPRPPVPTVPPPPSCRNCLKYLVPLYRFHSMSDNVYATKYTSYALITKNIRSLYMPPYGSPRDSMGQVASYADDCNCNKAGFVPVYQTYLKLRDNLYYHFYSTNENEGISMGYTNRVLETDINKGNNHVKAGAKYLGIMCYIWPATWKPSC